MALLERGAEDGSTKEVHGVKPAAGVVTGVHASAAADHDRSLNSATAAENEGEPVGCASREVIP